MSVTTFRYDYPKKSLVANDENTRVLILCTWIFLFDMTGSFFPCFILPFESYLLSNGEIKHVILGLLFDRVDNPLNVA